MDCIQLKLLRDKKLSLRKIAKETGYSLTNIRYWMKRCNFETKRIRQPIKERKRRTSIAVSNRRRKLKQLAVEYKGGKCQKCGYDKFVGALEFHHLNPAKKDFSISHDGHTMSWERLKIELDKCILLCSNCHKEEHEKIRTSS